MAAVPFAVVTALAGWAWGKTLEGTPSLAFFRWVGPGTIVINCLALLAFWTAILELLARSRRVAWESEAFGHKILPEDAETVIDKEYIPKIFDRIQNLPEPLRKGKLCQAVELCATKYHVSTTVGEVASAVEMHINNEAERAEAGSSLVRYLAWAIPSIGFIGTVMGLSTALGRFGQGATGEGGKMSSGLMENVSTDLMLAFNTTFTALVLAVILMYYLHTVTGRESGLLNRISDYCLKNFVTRAWYPPKS
jgi:chemotaxis protein MotA